MLEVVEGDERVGQHERQVGQPEPVGVGLAQRLDRAHAVVAEEPHRAAREGRQAGQRRLALALHLGGGERVGVAAVGQRPAHDPARAVADERPAAHALALLGRLQQERRTGAAQLEEGRDRGLAVLEEGVAHRDEVVLRGERAHLLERRADAEPHVTCASDFGSLGSLNAAATATEHLLGVGQREPAAAQQHGEVVEHVGGLLGHALVGLLARRARDLLGLLLDLVPDLAAGRRAGAPCRSSPARPRRARRRCAPGPAAPRAGPAARARRGESRCARRCGRRGRRARPGRAARRRRSRSGSRARPACCPTSRPCATARPASGSTGAARRSRGCGRAPRRSCRPASAPRPSASPG